MPTTPTLGDEIPIAQIEREEPVDFQKEVLPLLRKNCLACHNSTDAEGDLVLESPELMLKGGVEGPAIVKGNGAESYLIQLAAHQTEPVMPPEDNDVEAANFTSEELGLLKLWIDQGAEGSAGGPADVVFEKLPAGVNPVYGVTLSDDGQILAGTRANQIFLYHLPSKRALGRLTDMSLLNQGIYENPGVAHLDLVQAVAFSPNGEWLASSGYRNVKLWKRQHLGVTQEVDLGAGIVSISGSLDGTKIAVVLDSGLIKIVDTASGAVERELGPIEGAPQRVALSADAQRIAVANDTRLELWQLGETPTILAAGDPEGGVRQLKFFNNDSIAVAGADHSIRLVSAVVAEGEESEVTPGLEVKQVFKGHQAEISAVETWGQGDGLVSADKGGQVIHWNLENATPLRAMAHGGPVHGLALAPSLQRVMSFGDADSSKCWNLENGQLVLQRDGDFKLEVASLHAKQQSDLSARLVQLAKADLDQAQKQKTAEEENAKKAKEALTKATEEQTAKKKAADESEKAKVAAEAALATQQTKLKDMETGVANAEKQRVETEAKEKELTAQVAQAEKEVAEKMAMLAKMKETLIATQKDLQTVVAQKQELEKAIPGVQQEVKTAEEASKKAIEAAQKTKDELVAADRAKTGAQRTSERADQASKRAAEQVPVREKQVAESEEVQKQQQQLADLAATQFQQERPATQAATYVSSANVAVSIGGNRLTTWSVTTGLPLFSEPLTGGCLPVVVGDASGFAWIATGSTLQRISVTEQWLLARTIGNVRGESPFSDRVTALDFSPDSQLLAVGGGVPSRSGEISVWHVDSGDLVKELTDPHSDVVLGLSFSPDGKTLASAATDRFMKTFNLETGDLIRGFEGHTHHVQSVAWSADGRTLATGGSDNVVKVWNALTGDQLRTIQGFGKELTGVRFLGLSREIAVSAGDQKVHVKNVDNGGNVRQLGGFPDYVYCVDTSFNGDVIIGAGQDSVIRVWKRDGTALAEFAPPSE